MKSINNIGFRFVLWAMVLLFLSVSCNKSGEDPALPDGHPLLGFWVSQSWEDDVYVMARAPHFASDRYGFAIFPDSRFLEHKNGTGCGTPPVFYQVYDGDWKFISENLYEVTTGYWGGTMTFRIELISLDETTLQCKFIFGPTG